MVRTFLSLAATMALIGFGCSIPGTLGLPCETHDHCDDTQFCVQGTCMRAPPGETDGPTMTGPPLPTTMPPTTEAPPTSSTTDVSATSSVDPSSSSTGEDETANTSTGAACGVTSCTDLDVLLLIDTSDSMTQWLIPLSNSLPALFALFDDELSEVCSFHVGIANADRVPESNTPECQYAGALVQRPATCSEVKDALPYYTEADGTPDEAFDALQCTIVSEGFSGSDDEYMLESMLGVFNPENNAEGACNEGFRRPEADLVILYVSDENDPTPSDEQDTVADTFREYLDPNLVAFISVVADPTNGAPECVWDPKAGEEGTGAETPTALNGFLALSGIPLAQQARVDICQSDAYEFSDAFEVFSSVCGDG